MQGDRLEVMEPQLLNSLTTQVTSEDVAAIALYSASEEDLETVDCFLDLHDIGDFPNKRMKPVTDLLQSGQAAQSESEKACKTS